MSNPMIRYLDRIEVIRHPNPRSGRMRFLNYINSERSTLIKNVLLEGISVLARGKEEKGRIIIGPKDFDTKFNPFFSIETATAEEIQQEMERTYPMEEIRERLEMLTQEHNSQINQVKNLAKLRETSANALAAMGFGKKRTNNSDDGSGGGGNAPPNPYE